MKKYVFIPVLMMFVLSSCNRSKEWEAKNAAKNDSLQGIVDEKSEIISNFLSLFDGIRVNLDSISAREKKIYVKTTNPENVKTLVVKEINEDISFINAIIAVNKKTISDINRKLRQALQKNEKLESEMNSLNEQLAAKEKDLESLNNVLTEYDKKIISLQTTVGLLNDKNEALEENIAEKTKLMHTAYYILGTSKELQKDSIIDRKGGLIGIGKTPQLKDDFNPLKFTKIDYTETTSILINHKKIKIVTTHPSNSYSLESDKDHVKSIQITDPEKFWSASKYLVVIKS